MNHDRTARSARVLQAADKRSKIVLRTGKLGLSVEYMVNMWDTESQQPHLLVVGEVSDAYGG